ncbi:hypothetical protein CTAM01_02055 [Colletotrichum tamarilloi]|uniref:RNA recognition domain-containing protein n=1 Tax=Colletotrichum tamarilloi TaxID=1209934 RepID=A0ABQ9RQZ2_9PEZI|nr:uncharacterized protein CTAM01_02055 [Colletotrichum tamarilloi]KAI3533437.1 hypothetical protein CSPX01_12822 [Colletotrichum filicis]KAK1509932.1 hypothetical protein CTAM01_02055 [Colletotrichum tamarilloi]
MASTNDLTISIDRNYLDTLIRRLTTRTGLNWYGLHDCPFFICSFVFVRIADEACLKNTDNDPNSSCLTVTITRAEHDILVKKAQEFANLRRNLMRGGVTEATLAVLTCDESNYQEDNVERHATSSSEAPQNGIQRPVGQSRVTTATATRGNQNSSRLPIQQPVKREWAEEQPVSLDESEATISPVEPELKPEHGFEDQNDSQLPVQPRFERLATRTILISNLAEGTTHADIIGVVRGGQLLDIFMRPYDRTAHVSFLHGTDAAAFLEHTRRHDLYIRQKRVDVRWSDRHFTLPGHVASKLGIGASRNLILRRCDPKLTEEEIRDDMEHIHNLVVIAVSFRGGSCYINTNSVHNAMFARTCMMSRFKYKGSKIEWDVDECAQPLPAEPQRAQTQVPPIRFPMNPMTNRFELLKLDKTEEDEENTRPELHTSSQLKIVV